MKCVVCDREMDPYEYEGYDIEMCATCQNQEWLLLDDEGWEDEDG